MPKSQKPRHKQTKTKLKKVYYQPLVEHRYCPAEVRYVTNKGPHAAELYCLAHQKHIQWLSADMAPKWEQVLKTRPGLTSG